MTYDELLVLSDAIGLVTKEKDLQAYDGRIKNRRIAIRRSIPTRRKKACVLAEELGHYFTSSGNILDMNDTEARKQELRARTWAYNVQIGLDGLIAAQEAGCTTPFEIAEYLSVPESFLTDALASYRTKYGEQVQYRGRVVRFEPYLDVLTESEAKKGSHE